MMKSFVDKPNNSISDIDVTLPREEYYKVPDGFFAQEKQHIISLAQIEQLKNKRMRLIRQISIGAAAAIVVALSLTALSLFKTDSTVNPTATSPIAQSLDVATTNKKAAKPKVGVASDIPVIPQTSTTSWNDVDEVESADLLMWLY